MKTVTFTVKDHDLLDAKPVNAIKAVRQATGLGLKEAKDIVDYLRGYNGTGRKKFIDAGTGVGFTPLGAETKMLLETSGLVCNGSNEKTQHYVKQIRELACMMIMDGNEGLSRGLLDVTEKWGFPNEQA